ncbi:hypothetical protein LKC87_002234 [Salmonella enterica subsp. enterica serovar Aqua]|nr:hypothetical protein [Salmonella enterica subsp. enterica serovar Aqua]
MFAPENSFTVELCNAVPKRSLPDLLFFCFISLPYVVLVRGALAAFRSCKMTKAKNIFCFQYVDFSVRSFFDVDLANTGNLWHSVPNRFFCKAPVLARSGVSFCANLFGKKFLSWKAQARGACAAAVICPRCAVKSPRSVRVCFQVLRT